MLGIFHPARAGHAILKLTASLSAGRSSRPRPPGSSFSSGRKGCKRPFKRDFVPLKDSPVGEPSGRVPHTPTAGFLSGNSRCSESALAFFAGRTPPISAYIRYEPRVRVSAGWHALTVPGAAQRCGTTFQRLVCEDPPVRKCLRISESVRAVGAHKGPRRARPYQGSTVVSIWPSGHSVIISLPS